MLTRLAEAGMPLTTRALAEGLRTRSLHKRALELSTRAGAVFAWLDRLFFDRLARKRAEEAIGSALATASGLEIAAHEVLLDIPKPEKWETEVWVFHARPPVGMRPVMTWSEATGTHPEQLARYEQHQRRVRVVTTERVRDIAWARRLDVVLPTLERLAASGAP
jgi:hypothetical protein